MAVTWLEKDELMATFAGKLERADVVLDIGCGIKPQQLLRPRVHICCEPFDEYVEHLQDQVQHQGDRQFVVIRATWDQAVTLFPPRSVDTVFLLDLIEHLEKEESARLLAATERIARKQVAIFTPLGFMPQCHPDGQDAWGLGGGDMQEHKSGWNPEDFDDSWDLYIGKGFHGHDNLGRALEEPFGAIAGIKNIPQVATVEGTLSKRKVVHDALDALMDRMKSLGRPGR